MIAFEIAKLTKMAHISPFKFKIDFRILFVSGKTAKKPSTRTNYFFFHLLSVTLGELTIIGRGWNFSKFQEIGGWGGDNELRSVENN